MKSSPTTAAGCAAAVLALALLGSSGPAAADRKEAPRSVSDAAVADSVFDLEVPQSVVGIDVGASIEEMELEEVEGETTTITISADVLFEFDEASLSEDAEENLAGIAERLTGASGTVRVVGHSDGIGDPSYNQELSEKRAEAVQKALEEDLGADAPDIEAEGKGSTEPVSEETDADGNDLPSGRSQNRRVEISFEGT